LASGGVLNTLAVMNAFAKPNESTATPKNSPIIGPGIVRTERYRVPIATPSRVIKIPVISRISETIIDALDDNANAAAERTKAGTSNKAPLIIGLVAIILSLYIQ
jgi:hypothetical protein